MKDTLLAILDGLRECLCAALVDSTTGEGCFCGLYPGASTTADWCSCKGNAANCGMAWVRLDRVYASSQNFPALDAKPSCNAVLAAVIELGVYRCAPLPNRNGQMDPVAITNAVLRQVADADAMVRAAQCCDALTRRPHVLGTYLPTPGGGDCTGGTWPLTVQLLRR